MPLSRALIDALRQRAVKRKRKSRRLTPPAFPRGAELEYIRALKSLSREVSELIRDRVLPLLQQRRQDADNPVPAGIIRSIETLRIQVAEAVTRRAPAVAAKMVTGVGDASRKALNTSYKKVVGLEPWPNNDALRGQMGAALTRNVDLIRTIPNQQLDQVREVLTEGFATGARVETIRKELEERFDVSQSRAELIARDQVGKINAELNQERQEQIGVTSYIWQSSNDERVRSRHRELDGTRHTWSDPPVTNDAGDRNHPGEDYQCRCNAVADVEDVLTRLGL